MCTLQPLVLRGGLNPHDRGRSGIEPSLYVGSVNQATPQPGPQSARRRACLSKPVVATPRMGRRISVPCVADAAEQPEQPAASERATSEPPPSPILGGAIRSMGGHAAPPGGPVGARSLDRGPVDRPAMPVKCWDCRRRSDSEAGARAQFSSTRPPRAASFHPLLDDDVRSFCAAALLGC